jgi:hypothetical protein
MATQAHSHFFELVMPPLPNLPPYPFTKQHESNTGKSHENQQSIVSIRRRVVPAIRVARPDCRVCSLDLRDYCFHHPDANTYVKCCCPDQPLRRAGVPALPRGRSLPSVTYELDGGNIIDWSVQLYVVPRELDSFDVYFQGSRALSDAHFDPIHIAGLGRFFPQVLPLAETDYGAHLIYRNPLPVAEAASTFPMLLLGLGSLGLLSRKS